MIGPGELDKPLSEREWRELNEFLVSRAAGADSKSSMDVSELHGFLAAIVTGPMIMPSEWLPLVWGGDMEWASPEQAQRMITIVMRAMNDVSAELRAGKDEFEPLLLEDRIDGPPVTIVESWCIGYLRGLALRTDEWRWILDDDKLKAYVLPMLVFGAEDNPAYAKVLEGKDVKEELSAAIGPCAVVMHEKWAERRRDEMRGARVAPKPPVNGPCPCGSGKKYKKCCGSPLRSVPKQ
jgi:uncharacterized protein